MLSTSGRAVLAAVVAPSQTRSMVTLKDISVRLKSVKNIQKITQSMKMVSAAKYARAERDLKPARPYGLGAQSFYENANLTKQELKPDHIIVAMTSDRGLCGSVHTNVQRMVRNEMEKMSKTHNVGIVCVGDKAKMVLQRTLAKNIIMHCNDIGRLPPTFNDARVIANAILNMDTKFTQGDFYFNRFKTVVSYTTMKLPFYSIPTVQAADSIGLYDSIDEHVIKSYLEFSLASQVYYVLKESAC